MTKMYRLIETTMYEHKHTIYKMYRKEYDERIEKLDQNRKKIGRERRHKKEKQKMLLENSY